MPAKTKTSKAKTKAKPLLSASRSSSRTPPRKAPAGSRSASQPRSKRLSGSPDRSEAVTTTDLGEIRRWAEARQGKPATVVPKGKGKSKGKEVQPGILRIDFPGYSGKDTLKPITWEAWYQKFQERNLAFLYQEKTKTGKESRFFKLVNKS